MSQTPSTVELTALRASWDNWLFDTCNIHRSTKSQGDYGEVETDATVATGVACGLNGPILPGVQQVIAEKMSKVADAAISMPWGTDIRVADKVYVTSQGSRIFEVLYVPAPSTFESGVQAYVREVA